MNDTIGSRISQCRKALGLSQEALGEKMGVSRQAVNKWESDAAIPEIDKLVALSRLFDVSIGWLLGVEEMAEEKPQDNESLKAIEELLKNNPPARAPKWQKPLMIITAVCAALSLVFSIAATWRTGTNRAMIYTLNSQTSELRAENSDLRYQLSTLETTQEQSIPSDRLLESADFRITPSEDMSEARVSFYGLPRTYTEGDTAELTVLQDGIKVKKVFCLYDDPMWLCTVVLPKGTGYSYIFTLTNADGTTVQETVSAIEASDLEEQMLFSCASNCSSYSYSGGYLRLLDYSLWLDLPPVLRDMEDLHWNCLDFVLYRNGEEVSRTALDVNAGVIWEGKWWWSELALPLDAAQEGDQLELRVEGDLSGYKLSCTDQIWEIHGVDPILTYTNTIRQE